MNNGRENRNNGNQENGKEEETLSGSQLKVTRGRQKRPLSFWMIGRAQGLSGGAYNGIAKRFRSEPALSEVEVSEPSLPSSSLVPDF